MMNQFDPFSETRKATSLDDTAIERPQIDDAGPIPPVGVTPPGILAQEAATGRRGAAWRLLYWVIESDPRAVLAIASLDDDRLAQHLVEFIALGTWAGKRFVIPPPIRTAFARTQLRTLFLPRSGMDMARAERVLLSAARDNRPAVRETAMHILGIIGSPAAAPVLIEALQDAIPSVRMQAAKALGRVGDPSAVPALITTLRGSDEQMGSTIFTALVKLGPAAVPALLNASTSSSGWIRWQSIRALSEGGDRRALPVLVSALNDPNYSVAWMAAKGLKGFGKRSLEPVLRLLSISETTMGLAQTAAFILANLSQLDPTLKPYLMPLVQDLRGISSHTITFRAHKVLSQLIADGLVKET
ncbi:MAG: hypothetical protein NVS4B11_20680 [Ktedonobacteraceae bacterium]